MNQAAGLKRELIDWDSIEKKAIFHMVEVKKVKASHARPDKLSPAKYPPLPLQLSTLHLKAFIDFRCAELGFELSELSSSAHFFVAVRKQLIVEAFMLGFPIDYIYTHFNIDYSNVSSAIKDYCGDYGIQTIREKYGVSLYYRKVLRMGRERNRIC